MHFHGAEVRKPIPSYQIHKGTAFELVDRAVDFVMSKLARSVGTRGRGPRAPVRCGLPKEAVTEAIVNAVAHRDYTSNASVQVMLFIDRLEVWSPGELPPGLTPEQLRREHASIPHNPLISEPLFLAHYIEKAGTGTLDMIDRCREANLPEPDFEERAGQFVVTLWRDWLTEAVIAKMGLNERRKKVVVHLREVERITNADYQRVSGATRKTSMRDLADLVNRGVLERIGTRKGAYYRFPKKWDIYGPNGPTPKMAQKWLKRLRKGSKASAGNPPQTRQSRQRGQRRHAGRQDENV
ncbi:MAG: hypothetical protein HYV00_05175 [Deltaproteobacteria bacterium]|nr:hypothetical protein [Deltaproteobacteria bacterium]